jgi:hypothetical protein
MRRQKTDALHAFCKCLQRLTFSGASAIFDEYLVEVRIPLVAGPAFPISFGGPGERGIAVDPPKSLRQLIAEAAGGQA